LFVVKDKLEYFGSLWHVNKTPYSITTALPKKRRNLLVFQHKTPRPACDARADFRIEFGAPFEFLLNAVSNDLGGSLVPPRGKNNLAVQFTMFLRRVDLRQYSINEFGEQPAHAPVGKARAAICGLAGFAVSCAHSSVVKNAAISMARKIFPTPSGNAISSLHGIVSVSCSPRSF